MFDPTSKFCYQLFQQLPKDLTNEIADWASPWKERYNVVMKELKEQVQRYGKKQKTRKAEAKQWGMHYRLCSGYRPLEWEWDEVYPIDEELLDRKRIRKIMNREVTQLLYSFPRDHVLYKDNVAQILTAHKSDDPIADTFCHLARFTGSHSQRERIWWRTAPRYTRSKSRKRKREQLKEEKEDRDLDQLLKRTRLE